MYQLPNVHIHTFIHIFKGVFYPTSILKTIKKIHKNISSKVVILAFIHWQRIHVGMDEMYEMDQKFYTQLAKASIVFFFLR